MTVTKVKGGNWRYNHHDDETMQSLAMTTNNDDDEDKIIDIYIYDNKIRIGNCMQSMNVFHPQEADEN